MKPLATFKNGDRVVLKSTEELLNSGFKIDRDGDIVFVDESLLEVTTLTRSEATLCGSDVVFIVEDSELCDNRIHVLRSEDGKHKLLYVHPNCLQLYVAQTVDSTVDEVELPSAQVDECNNEQPQAGTESFFCDRQSGHMVINAESVTITRPDKLMRAINALTKAVKEVNDLGYKLELFDSNNEVTYLGIANEDEMYVSKNIFGQDK